MDNEDDSSFLTLSARLRRRIDRAFDSVVSQSGTQSESNVSPGGFVVEESESGYGPGGFIVVSNTQSHIPLSEIPRALSLLNLSLDADIMGAFKNAATGWGAQDARNDGVGRKDWRAVCAALFEGNGSDEEHLTVDEDLEMDAESGPESDEYQLEELSGETEEGSSDEYEEPEPLARAKEVPATTTRTKSSGTDARQLSDTQKAQCRQEFGRFFPDVPDNELDHERIMIKDIVRVANLLKENIKTEEIVDMLEAFSTSPDKSMNLSDFEHMMTLTKLV